MAASITHAVVKWISKSQIQVNYVKISDIDNVSKSQNRLYSVMQITYIHRDTPTALQ